jgi:hypothetical protein
LATGVAVALDEEDEFPEEFVATVELESGVPFPVELESSFTEGVLPPLVSGAVEVTT